MCVFHVGRKDFRTQNSQVMTESSKNPSQKTCCSSDHLPSVQSSPTTLPLLFSYLSKNSHLSILIWLCTISVLSVAKWLKNSTVDQKSQVRIPPVASQVKCFSLPFLPLGDQPLAKGPEGKKIGTFMETSWHTCTAIDCTKHILWSLEAM